MDTQDTRTWEVALDELEGHLDRAERMLRASGAEDILAWEPPGVGAIPRYLVPRAQTLLERQQSVIDRIPAAMTTARQQLRLTERVGRATARATPPVYLDVTA